MKPDNLLTLISSPVMLLASGHLVVDLYSGFIIPILPFIARKLEISLPLAGLVIAFTGLSSSFLQPVYGYFSDRISKRLFVFWGLVISSIFIGLCGAANTYVLLITTVVIGNLGVGLYHPQATAYTGKLKTNKTNLNMGIFVAGGIIGYALGPMLSSSIVYFIGLEWTILAAVPGIITAALIYLYLPKISFEKQSAPLNEIIKNFSTKKHIIIPIVFVIIIRSLILMAMSTYFPFEWEDNLGQSVLTVGIVMTLFSFLGGTASIIGGSLAAKFGERKILILSFIIPLPILLLALYYMKTYLLLSFALYIIGGAILESGISINIVLGQRAIPMHIGIISGITGGFSWGIAGFLMFPIGILISNYNIYSVLEYILLLSVVAVILTYLIPQEIFTIPAENTNLKNT
ncbi:MAG: MFS transporter [Cyanobacteriota bacterium]